ncbi:MAG: VOC family protein [Flavitalea sp.]
MASVATYLNFAGNTEDAFNFYKSVFGGEFFGGSIMRHKDVPQMPGSEPLNEKEQNMVMHIELRILGVHTLMGTDIPDSMGMKLDFGNNSSINVQPDTRAETAKLFKALSEGGQITMELQDMFWGDYYGSFIDKFGVQWMFNCGEKK